MKKIALLFTLFISTGFADNLVLENQTSYPAKNQKSKIAIQWANSAKEVEDGNAALMYGDKLEAKTFEVVKQTGKVVLDIPQSAEYFRVVVWTENKEQPELNTNWVEIVPNKTYTLKSDHLVPSVLMLGMGC